LIKPDECQDVEIIALKDGQTVVIHCMKYLSPAGTDEVEKAQAGKLFFKADVAIVVSSTGFTGSAIQLAHTLGVFLIDRSSVGILHQLVFSNTA